MWSIRKVASVTGRIVDNVYKLRTNQLSSSKWFCTAKINSIPDEIKYPNGNEKLKEYLDNLKENQSTWKHQNSQLLNSLINRYENRLEIVDQYNELTNEMANEMDNELIALGLDEKQRFTNLLMEIDDMIIDEIVTMNDDEPDVNSMMFEVHVGVGGQEAMLFARELFDMYNKYIKFKKWNHDVLAESNTGLGGIRSASIVVRGYAAYEMLKNEAGVHRVQRVPKTERSGRIHTSTAVVLVIPCADEIDIRINPNDLRIETKRSSGPGGQNANKLDTAVRIVHIPTGIATECQEERTQTKNKKIAMAKLYNLLYQIEFNKQISTEAHARKSQTGLRQRNEKLRTYNYPQNRITDHRINGPAGTMHNLEEFLNGTDQFDDFMEKTNRLIRRQQLHDILDNK